MAIKSRSQAALPITDGVNLIGFWRLYEIHKKLAANEYPNSSTIARDLEIAPRTAERDIGRLRDLFGAPIEYDASKRGYRYTEPFELPSMKLREGEAIALFLGQKLLMQCKGTPFEEFVQRAMAKIKVMLPQSIEVNLEKVLGSVSFHTDPLRGDEMEVAQRYQTLTQAIEEQKSVVIEYYTASRRVLTNRKIDPYHLRLFDGAWYCIGYCHERKEIRTFALDRMTSMELTSECFEIPSDFSVDEYLAGSWSIERGEVRKVVIEFDPTQAPYIRGRRWHGSQVIEDLPGGGLRMTLHVGGMGEVMRWVMSLGSHAWVVEPEDLRERVKRELEGARGRY